MPSSRADHLHEFARLIEHVNPRSVLDLGIGSGLKGAMFREYTDVWNYGVIHVDDPRAIDLVGVEIWPKYRNPLWDLYNHVYISDAIEVLRLFGPGSFDLVHAGDIIEHMTESDGRTLAEEMKRVARRVAVIVTPVEVLEQGKTWGNPHEAHISQWTTGSLPGWTVETYKNVAMYTSTPWRSL